MAIMIETVFTFSLTEENKFTSCSPLLFTCRSSEGFAPYYVKYIKKENEFDCLVYEIICQRLAKYFEIKTPEIALVNIVEESFSLSDIPLNRQYLVPGVIGFGSKVVSDQVMLNKAETVPDKHTFNLYASPLDLVKIVLLDLHVYNTDRSEENFNILLTSGKSREIFAIDHFDCFGSSRNAGKIHASLPVNRDGTILRSSYFCQMLKYLELRDILATIDEYFYLCIPQNFETIVDEVLASIPSSWLVSQNLRPTILNLLTSEIRQRDVREKVTEFIHYQKAQSK